jgi:hypothetical protein
VSLGGERLGEGGEEGRGRRGREGGKWRRDKILEGVENGSARERRENTHVGSAALYDVIPNRRRDERGGGKELKRKKEGVILRRSNARKMGELGSPKGVLLLVKVRGRVYIHVFPPARVLTEG